jgi:putative SOS response-associated peptidase YedK
MKWGLIPSWTKRSPDYASTLKTINCRDDSLASPGGLWASMKGRKRCIVFAQGFYEWLKKGPGGKERIPYYIKRKDGKPLLMAGLWDCVRYEEGEEVWSYTVVTTSSNKQLKFLHDRMPVILEPEEVKVWLDPGRTEWNRELQGLLRPWGGELEVYQVSKEVGKVGNNSKSFVVPVGEGKGSIEQWFGKKKGEKAKEKDEVKNEVEIKNEEGETKTMEVDELAKTADDGGLGEPQGAGVKREAPSSPGGEPPKKKMELTSSPVKTTSPFKTTSPAKKPQGRGKISATSNAGRSPAKNKGKADGNQKITKFFGNSA